ncbi:MAG: DNA topoisomerase IV subunit B, partial [Oscillospiraceae bacterium]|nr:DNA topoisomerase IV subunit B [Oscillospiraceae bacterium]
MAQLEDKVETNYGGEQIQVLEGLEAVRKRPGMYIGSTGPKGLHHLVYEIVDNSIDEALAGYCDNIQVSILEDNIIEVKDNGRGIPVGIQPKLGIPAVTVVFTILHAGGKFGGEGSGYKVSGGLHGVGASVVNALSEWLTVEVRNGEGIYRQSFKRGVADGDLARVGDTEEKGTTVRFKADSEMFETCEYEYDVLATRLREQSFLNAGVRITFSDFRDSENVQTEVMHYEGGVKSFVEYIHTKRDMTTLHPVIHLKTETDNSTAEIALQYNDSYNELLLSFANNINTPDGGTHEQGFKNAMTRVFNDFGRAKGYIKDKDDNLSGNDVREGLTAIISV